VGIGRQSVTQPSSGATTLAIQGTQTGKAGAIRFYSSDDSVQSYIYTDSASGLSLNTATSHPMVFRTANVERMRIDTSGNLLVGTTSNSVYNDVSGTGIALNAGQIQIAGTGAPLYVNRQGSNGTVAEFRKDGATVGSIGAYNGVPYIGYAGGAGGGIMFNGASIEPTALGSSRTNGANDIGSVTYRWRDIYLSGGVYLGGTAAANKLDDYEEGTFTATLKGGSTGSITATDAEYTKIGNTVHCRIAFINVNTTGYSGHLRVEGLPFPAGDSGLRNVCTPAMYRIGAFTADYVIGLLESSTHVNFYGVKSANTWNTVAHDAGSGRYLEFNITYNTNA